MDNEYTDSQYIEDYLRDKLTENEKLQFESRLEKDASFNLIYKRHLSFGEILKENHNREVKGFLKNVEGQGAPPKDLMVVDKGNSRRNILVGLLLLIFGIISLFVFKQIQDVSTPQDIFAEYYKPFPNTLVKIERGENATSDLHNAMLRYTKRDYNQAITAFDNILKEDGSNDSVRFYKAISMLEIEQTENAISILEQLKAKVDFDMISEVRWYLSLAYLKSDNRKSATLMLSEIIESNQVYQKTNAKKLKELLSK